MKPAKRYQIMTPQAERKDLKTSAPYRHVNFLKIIAIKWKSSYTVGSVIDHFQRSAKQRLA